MVERPAVDLAQIGIAAAGKGAQQVERRRRLAIGAQHPSGSGMRCSGVNSMPLMLSPR
jgi:hypothetical protein